MIYQNSKLSLQRAVVHFEYDVFFNDDVIRMSVTVVNETFSLLYLQVKLSFTGPSGTASSMRLDDRSHSATQSTAVAAIAIRHDAPTGASMRFVSFL